MAMRSILSAITMSALMVGEAHAADWQNQGAEVRTGAFVGARLKLSLGDRADAKPHAQLALAPSRSSISNGGFIRTRIGEGAAFDLQPGSKPALMIAGMRAESALGLRSEGQARPGRKLGVSSSGWVAIGLGVVVLAGGLYFLHLVDEADKASD